MGQMQTRQAIVAVGGRATRLRAAGLDVPVSKSFMAVNERPLLHWNLLTLHQAGIRSLIISGDRRPCLEAAAQVVKYLLDELGVTFRPVRIVQDRGLGVHGLPHQIRDKSVELDDRFIFECGHSLMTPEHYRKLDAAKEDWDVVFSAFVRNPSNPRQPVELNGSKVRLSEGTTRGGHVLAHPMVIDAAYVDALPRLEFDISRIIRYYSARDRLGYILSGMPPEFDVREEYSSALRIYQEYLGRANPGRLLSVPADGESCSHAPQLLKCERRARRPEPAA